MYNGWTPTPLEQKERQLRMRIASITGSHWYGRTISEMIDELECTCRPDDVMACPACRIQAQVRFGDEIPFNGE